MVKCVNKTNNTKSIKRNIMKSANNFIHPNFLVCHFKLTIRLIYKENSKKMFISTDENCPFKAQRFVFKFLEKSIERCRINDYNVVPGLRISYHIIFR